MTSPDTHAVSERFANAVVAWFAAHDAAVADLIARHEQHKAALQKEWNDGQA